MSYLNIMFIVLALIILCMCFFVTCKLLLMKKVESSIHNNSRCKKVDYRYIHRRKYINVFNSIILCNIVVIGCFSLGINVGKNFEQKVAVKNTEYYNSGLLVKGEIAPVKSVDSNNSTIKETILNDELIDICSFNIINGIQEINIMDSYGNVRKNALVLNGNNSYATFFINGEYSSLTFNVSASNESEIDNKGFLTIIADDNIIYLSSEITKTTLPFDINISINKCRILSIEYNSEGLNPCIVSEVKLFN